jgi:hypothetical protein
VVTLDVDTTVERIARGLRAARDTPAHRVNDLGFIRNELAPDGLRALDALADEVRRLREALVEARPYVYNRTMSGGGENWREQTARDVLGRVDAALSREPAEKGTK